MKRCLRRADGLRGLRCPLLNLEPGTRILSHVLTLDAGDSNLGADLVALASPPASSGLGSRPRRTLVERTGQPAAETAALRGCPDYVGRVAAYEGDTDRFGKAHPYHNAKDVLVIVLRELAKADPSFHERCPRHLDTQSTSRT